MRVNKSDDDPLSPPQRQRMVPEVRRAHILDAAQSLFFTRGWDNVTINDVLDEAGISKGGFYHHFAAKADLLDGIVERFTIEALEAVQAIRAGTSGDALQRFNAFLNGSIRWKTERAHELYFSMDVMRQPGNDILFHRISNAVAEFARPVLREMIAEGIMEDHFDVPDADLIVDVIMALPKGRSTVDGAAIRTAEAGDLDRATTLLNDRMMAEGVLLDRLLGLPEGSIVLSNGLVARVIGWVEFALTRTSVQATASNLARPSSVILLRMLTPILASVFWVGKLRAFRFRPMTIFQRPI